MTDSICEHFHIAASHPALSWTELALAGGYSDQPHFNREFHAFTGITPS